MYFRLCTLSIGKKCDYIVDCCCRAFCRLVNYINGGKGSGAWIRWWCWQGKNRIVRAQVRNANETVLFTSTLTTLLSMGGLLAADTFLAIAHARPDKTAPLWPRIVACIAFDTPVRPSGFISPY